MWQCSADGGGAGPGLSPQIAGLAGGRLQPRNRQMSDEPSRPHQRADGSLWLRIDPASPLHSAVREVEVAREVRRWMAAPRFSQDRWLAKPEVRRIGWLRAVWLLMRESLRPRDELAERLKDIERLILGGHNDAADRQIDRWRSQFADDECQSRVLGLMSLNSYDRGQEREAQFHHFFALLAGSAHPAMIEIFGDTPCDEHLGL